MRSRRPGTGPQNRKFQKSAGKGAGKTGGAGHSVQILSSFTVKRRPPFLADFRRLFANLSQGNAGVLLGPPSLQKCVCEIFGEIWFGIRFEIWNFRWERSGEIFGEDFSTYQESTKHFGANFGENSFQISRLFSGISFSRRAVLGILWQNQSWGIYA